jgi:hypothetical protein
MKEFWKGFREGILEDGLDPFSSLKGALRFIDKMIQKLLEKIHA